MMTAMLAVKNILAGQEIYDLWEVNEDASYHEAGVESSTEPKGRMIPARLDLS